jgi:general secretion pathway protein G
METIAMNEHIRNRRGRAMIRRQLTGSRRAWRQLAGARLARRAERGVTLVEVLIVVAIMAVISGGVTLVAFPLYQKAKVDAAMVGCHAVKQAAELYQNLEGSADVCPQVSDLVKTKKIEASKTEDPWGAPYRIDCSTGEIRVCSNGKNKKAESTGASVSGDDVCDNYSPADVKKIKDLM